MKTCRKCKISKEIDAFNSQEDTSDKLRSWCRECSSAYSKDWAEGKKGTSYRRGTSLKARYGITEEDFNIMHEAQNGLCALCDKSFSKIARVEHCHTTGKIRGLVCDGCNLTIAFFEKFQQQPELTVKIRRYLEKVSI